MRHFIWAVLVLLLLPMAELRPQNLQRPPEKSARVGVGIALASTLVPTLIGGAAFLNDVRHERNPGAGTFLLAYGVIVGPYPGNSYAGDERNGMVGLGIRAALAISLGMAVTGVGTTWNNNISDDEEILIAGALTLGLGTVLWNLWTIPGATRRYKEGWTVGPSFRPDGGLGLQMTRRW